MKRYVLAASLAAMAVSPVAAADVPKAIAKSPPAVWDWTGIYLGAHAGIGVQRSRSVNPGTDPLQQIDHLGHAFTGGGAAGFNWQATRNVVVGIEGDIGTLSLKDRRQNYFETLVYDQQTSWVSTVRGRAGWSSGPHLSYVTAGAAWVKVRDRIAFVAGGGDIQSNRTLSGFAWGTGTETMLGGGWTAKSETLFVNAGRGDILDNGPFTYQTDKHRYAMQRFGVNYLFGGRAQPPLPAFSWTGAYVGGVFGSATSENRGVSLTGTPGEFNNNGAGYQGGGQIGYNWQFAPAFVAGVEGDISWLGIDRSHVEYGDSFVTGVKTRWVATLRGRIGYSIGPALLYVTGGAAWVNVADTFIVTDPAVTTRTLSGHTFGGGLETALGENWVSRSEYLYVDAGRGPVNASAAFTLQQSHSFHLFRSSVAYRFGG